MGIDSTTTFKNTQPFIPVRNTKFINRFHLNVERRLGLTG